MASQPSGLQFDKVEFGKPDEGVRQCASCHSSIADQYYEVASQPICGRCHGGAQEALFGKRGRWGRFLRALAYGLAGGAAGCGIYYAIREASGYEISLVSIVVGVIVGRFVRAGARGRGGWLYQGLAIILTYVAIASTYIPPIVRGELDFEAREAAKIVNETQQEVLRVIITREGGIEVRGEIISLERLRGEMEHLKQAGGIVWYHRQGALSTPAPVIADRVMEAVVQQRLPIRFFVDQEFMKPALFLNNWAYMPWPGKVIAGALVAATALKAPFTLLPDNLLGLLIIGFGVWQAWKANRRPKIRITGPYFISPPATAAAMPNEPLGG